MTPQIPAYLVVFESAVRPFVTAVALGLIWTGAFRMEGPAQARYTTAGALSVTLVAWLAIAQYVGAANMYFAATDTAVPTLLLGLTIPLMIAAAGWWRLRSIASAAAYSSCSGLTDACPGNSRCPRGLGTLRPACSPSSWLRGCRRIRLAPAAWSTPGAFSESPIWSRRLRWGQ
jgi:hypothetical protein